MEGIRRTTGNSKEKREKEMRKVIGKIMLTTPFVAILALGLGYDPIATLLTLGITLAFSAWVITGVCLLVD